MSKNASRAVVVLVVVVVVVAAEVRVVEVVVES